MAYGGDPSASSRDAVRFLIGDTDTTTALLGDDEVDFCLTEEGSNIYRAAALAAETLASEYANKRSKSVGNLSIQYGDLVQRMEAKAKMLRKRAKTKVPVEVYSAGEDDGTHVWKGMHDHATVEYEERDLE